MKKQMRAIAVFCAAVLMTVSATACGSSKDSSGSGGSASKGSYFDKGTSSEDIIKAASAAGKIGNWGIGNEYELLALLTKYDLPNEFVSQAFDMDSFDDDSLMLASAMTYNELGLVKNDYDGGYGYGDTVGTIDMNDEGVAMLEDNIFCTQAFAEDSITLASAMTYNELGLVKNDYEGGYGYGDSVGIIDMNDEGVAMLEDNLFCSKAFAEANPNTVKAFVAASMKGWEYACENPDEAAEIVFNYGSSVSPEHQKYMASEVAKLVTTDMSGNAVGLDNLGQMEETAMQQTLDLAKQYIKLDDSAAAEKLGTLTLDDVRDTSYWEAATSGSFGTPEKTDVTVQLKWLPQAQFMGYYVALDKGYYNDVGLNVTITPGGGDISETTAVYNGTVDFGVTWFCNLISADAAGMGLTEVAQVYQRSGLELVYKLNQD